MSDSATTEDLDQFLDSLDQLLERIENEAPQSGGSSLLPASIGRFVGKASISDLASSARGNIEDLRSIQEIDAQYSSADELEFSGSSRLAAAELDEILGDLSESVEDAGAPDEIVDSIESHKEALGLFLEVTEGAEPSSDPMERAMNDINESVGEGVDLDDEESNDEFDVEDELRMLKEEGQEEN